MTGPGHPSSSPWVQSAQGAHCDSGATHSLFHSRMSPSNTGLLSSSSVAERPSPNYFGIAVENPGNPPTSSPGLHTQKNWGSLSRTQSSIPSPEPRWYPQESVPEGLANRLKSESESNKERRDSGSQKPRVTNGQILAKHLWSKPYSPHTSAGSNVRVDGQSSERGHGIAKTGFSSSQASVPYLWVSAERCAELLKSHRQTILLLDVRPYAHHVQSNIKESLNLCIPTTLLKRRSFDTQKLENTFTNDADKQKFARWRQCSVIIVYDSNTAERKDAAPLLNVIEKFQTGGWEGDGMVLQNGFEGFADRFPRLIHRPGVAGPSPKKRSPMSIDLKSVAPVVGGCALPESSYAINPFFGNIRQNMDLVGGVGQIPLKQPDDLTEPERQSLPLWLRDASNVKDQGYTVSDKFLDLEKKELERMKQALAYKGSSASAGGASKKYRVAGIEKGTKNRYNDIYPFDHSRVRLEGIPSGACDYVNANYMQAEFSNRRYIATQAPVPDTFNDFWRVVWEQDIRLLVSLTAELERGQVKCHPYWESGDYGPFKVKAYSERYIYIESKGRPIDTGDSHSGSSSQHPPADGSNENPVIIVRHFGLSHTGFPFQPLREITQLQYPYWPDFGTTSQPTHLLNLIEQCNKVIRATSPVSYNSQQAEPRGQRPILVHCSAGCGRTGTFCTVDSVLDMLKRQRAESNRTGTEDPPAWIHDDRLDLIAKTVEDFRTQRPSMVQNLSQFVLCYESVLEWFVSQFKNQS
ncbi:hypothetical protein NUU61_005604 [Penicillium alfredii]|uniref:protein-tyrosine-phosphatase n=1 Tax=Penicillium alfredii TaxID=1506179 RepID=A0A9W9F9U2_9EURO|nr:uncharacterized protein NUU61_005604 [Penicillium alfredii]KAJ5096248.1 hypothetical protein NUU61_005604 [Penicillium alfredii]